jgi:hypothetical protein
VIIVGDNLARPPSVIVGVLELKLSRWLSGPKVSLGGGSLASFAEVLPGGGSGLWMFVVCAISVTVKVDVVKLEDKVLSVVDET